LRITIEYLLSNSNGQWITIAKNILHNSSLTWEIPDTKQTLTLRITASDSSNPPQTSIALTNIHIAEAIPEFSTILVPIILIVSISLLIILKRTTKTKKPQTLFNKYQIQRLQLLTKVL
jgi:hypothetical protein